jgi:hypothetical protein
MRCSRRPPPRASALTLPPHAPQGTVGNAAQYVTRNQAIKKLQLSLAQFR